MFERVRQRVRDVKTLSALCKGAERQARDDGQHEPGAEHFLLSALDLPDGSARRVFERLHVDASQLRGAIRRQYADALRHIGVDPGTFAQLDEAPSAVPPKLALFRASVSGQAVMQGLAQLREHKGGELLGAHVVAVVATMQHGVAARALRAMGVDAAALAAAAADEVEASAAS